MLVNRRGQRGDTIVEVLICIAVAGAVVVGAFAVSNRSQLTVRDSQEHSEASKLIEGQLEQLRSNAKSQGGTVFTGVGANIPFCMVNAGVVKWPGTVAGPQCKLGPDGAPSNEDNAYTIKIMKTSSSSGVQNAGSLFDITVSWFSVTGKGTSQEEMLYRLYP